MHQGLQHRQRTNRSEVRAEGQHYIRDRGHCPEGWLAVGELQQQSEKDVRTALYLQGIPAETITE